MASTTLLPAITNHQVACKLLLTGDLITAQVRVDMPQHLCCLRDMLNLALTHFTGAVAPAGVAATNPVNRAHPSTPEHLQNPAVTPLKPCHAVLCCAAGGQGRWVGAGCCGAGPAHGSSHRPGQADSRYVWLIVTVQFVQFVCVRGAGRAHCCHTTYVLVGSSIQQSCMMLFLLLSRLQPMP